MHVLNEWQNAGRPGIEYYPIPLKKSLACLALIVFALHNVARAEQGQATMLRMQRGTQKPVTLESVQLVMPSTARLSEYEGEYRSDEVLATYKIVVENGKLFLRHENEYKDYPKSPLESTVSDTFFIEGITLRFERNAGKRVAAFTLNAGRVKNIRFVKKAT